MADDASLDIREILHRLPHRHPILLVDRVIELKPGVRTTAIKNVTINEDFFRGHFPGNPIMPGVLIVEAMAQAAGLLVSASVDRPESRLPYVVGMDAVRFRRPVVPGDRLLLEAELRKNRGRFWRLAARALVEGELAAEANLLLAILEQPEAGR